MIFGRVLVLRTLFAVALLCDRCCSGQTVAETDSLTSHVGGYAVFECPAPQSYGQEDSAVRRPLVVRWSKDGQTVFTYSNGALITDERYDGRTSIIEPPDLSSTVFVAINVSSLRESDTGDYECHVTFGGGGGFQSTLSTPLQSLSSPLPSSLPPLPSSSPPLPSSLPPLTSPPSSTVPSSSIAVSTDFGARDGVRFVRLDVQGGDVMSIPPINQTRMEHESVHFSCVKEDPHSAVQWYKDGVPLDDVPSLTGRFLVTPEGSLDVYDASPNDNGFYSCRIVSVKGALSAGAFLNVQYKAKIDYSPPEVFLAYGKPGTLDCNFHSNPPLTKIRWEKDGFLFDTYNVPGVYHKLNGSLYFEKVENEHGGKYTCTPFNDLGTEGPSTPMDVIVQHPPKLIVTPKVVYFCKLGDNITMPCEAENTGKIGPAIVWQKADGKSLFDPRVIVAGGNLTLTGVRDEDRGVYRCVASNIAATISAETQLIVEEKSLHRKNFDLHINSTDKNIVAYWKRPYSLCTVWSRDTSLASSKWNTTATTSEGKAVLWNLNPARVYEIMVSCRDEMSGESIFSKSILTRPKEPTQGSRKSTGTVDEDPFNIRVERSGINYNVSWTIEKPGIEHHIKRYVVKWYDVLDGKELGSATTAANEPYTVVELAGGRTYGIRVEATGMDGRQMSTSRGRTFQTPAAATATSPSPSTAITRYYYMTLFGMLVAGFVALCCNCRGDSR